MIRVAYVIGHDYANTEACRKADCCKADRCKRGRTTNPFPFAEIHQQHPRSCKQYTRNQLYIVTKLKLKILDYFVPTLMVTPAAKPMAAHNRPSRIIRYHSLLCGLALNRQRPAHVQDRNV